MAFALTEDREKKLTEILSRYPTKMAACIPALHLCQDQNGWISEDVILWVAHKLDLSPAHVKGVVTFYTLFNQHPVGKHQVWVCRTLPCALRGSAGILSHCEKKLGIKPGETTEDKVFTLRTAECLASCGTAPMMQVDKEYYENLTPERVDAILDALREGEEAAQMTIKRTDYLTKIYGLPEGFGIGVYEREGGYQTARKVLTSMTREQVVEEAKKANIRGRGGAGFPMGVKWGFMPKTSTKPCYLAVNADEGEPGTHKDRTIMELNPHSVIEGCIISCYGIGAHTAYIYVRDELHLSKARLEQAIEEARKKGYLGKSPFGKDWEVNVWVHTGAGAYICGEETSMLNSLEGKRGEPRLKPPFPAQFGIFGCPTTVNNLETIAIVPTAFKMGCDEFSKLSTLHHLRDGGTRLYGINGHVKKPQVIELAVGVTLRELIYDIGGGITGDRELLGVIPGGIIDAGAHTERDVNAPDEKSPLHPWNGQSVLDVPLGVDTMRGVGTMLGTCCITVLAEGSDPVLAMHNLMQFYRHESCGQCTPCREGSAWLHQTLDKIIEGNGTMDDVDKLHDIANGIMGNTICAFGEGTAMPALAFVQKYRKHFEAWVRGERKLESTSLEVT